MDDRVETAAEARKVMLDWAEGRKSYANFFRVGADRDIAATEAHLTVADAQEVVKWAAVYQAMAVAESLRGDVDAES